MPSTDCGLLGVGDLMAPRGRWTAGHTDGGGQLFRLYGCPNRHSSGGGERLGCVRSSERLWIVTQPGLGWMRDTGILGPHCTEHAVMASSGK